jgi:hypothetical protein
MIVRHGQCTICYRTVRILIHDLLLFVAHLEVWSVECDVSSERWWGPRRSESGLQFIDVGAPCAGCATRSI